jgi:hypothetical protein|tara:strand:- start:5615 stop:5785 length:171 start_codon:yes stop_codon:yes gene_type:complete
MTKFKYYPVKSISKEAIGKVEAKNKEEAYEIASALKQLPTDKFKKLFKVSIFKHGE